MKRVISLLLALVMVFVLLPATASANELDNGLKYVVYEDHVEISGYTGNATEVVIPAEIEGLPVTAIGDYVFSWCTNLTSIELPDHITYIGNSAFYQCSRMTSIVIPIGVTSIGDAAFWGCSGLTHLDIPSSVTSIGYSPFAYCDSLTGIHVNENNANYYSDARGVLFNKDKTFLIQAPGAISDIYTIPESVTTLGEQAFSGCSDLVGVDIPDSLTSISNNAFFGCGSLASIEFPKTLTSIGDCAFSRCSSLTDIYFNGNAPTFGEDVFTYVDATAYYRYGTPTWTEDVMQNYGGNIDWVAIGASEEELTRSMFFYALWCYCGSPEPSSTAMKYTDIDDSDYYYNAICWAIENDIRTGATSELFRPYASMTRSQAATYLHDALCNDSDTITDNPFTDIEDGMFYTTPVLWACAEGYMSPLNSDKTFYPQDTCLRSHINWISNESTQPNGLLYESHGDYVVITGYAGDSTELVIPAEIDGLPVTGISNRAFQSCYRLTSIYFDGNAPKFGNDAFYGVSAIVYYPANNATWTEDIMQDYGGLLTWIENDSSQSEPVKNPFTDVPAGAWFEKPVLWALENGITTGTSDTTFSPGDKCLRAHVVTFLWNAEKTPEPTAYTKSFSDVPAGAWYYKPVHWAVEHGITSGVSDTKFGAGDVCSRYQVVFFLWKAAGSPEPETTVNPFTDVNPGHFFYKAVLWAVENGITSGTSATTFGPTAPCNRAQVVTFLYAAYN